MAALHFLLLAFFVAAVRSGETNLDDKGKFQLSWQLNRADKSVTFTAVVATKGWVGLGFSEDGGMENADMVIGGVKPDGQNYFLHRYGLEEKPNGEWCPAPQANEYWTLLDVKEVDDKTTFKVKRPLNPGYATAYSLDRNPVTVIYAFKDDDYGEDCASYHGPENRGSKKITL